AASPSARNRLTPSQRTPERLIAWAICMVTLNRCAPVASSSSDRSATCFLGMTSRCPGWTGPIVIKALTISSEYTELAGAFPASMSQKVHDPIIYILHKPICPTNIQIVVYIRECGLTQLDHR